MGRKSGPPKSAGRAVPKDVSAAANAAGCTFCFASRQCIGGWCPSGDRWAAQSRRFAARLGRSRLGRVLPCRRRVPRLARVAPASAAGARGHASSLRSRARRNAGTLSFSRRPSSMSCHDGYCAGVARSQERRSSDVSLRIGRMGIACGRTLALYRRCAGIALVLALASEVERLHIGAVLVRCWCKSITNTVHVYSQRAANAVEVRCQFITTIVVPGQY